MWVHPTAGKDKDLVVWTPSPRACLTLGGTILTLLTVLDLIILAAAQTLPPSQLHHLVVAAGAALTVAGLVGLHMRESVELGRQLERVRAEATYDNPPGRMLSFPPPRPGRRTSRRVRG